MHTLSYCGLQLPSATQEAYLLPDPDGSIIVMSDSNQPTSSLLVFRIFPEWLDAGTEYMDTVVLSYLQPRHVVEDAIELADI